MKSRTARKYFAYLSIALVLLSIFASPAMATLGEGSVSLSVAGYSAIQGELQSVIIYPNDTVSMVMTVNSQLQTSYGTFPVTATGLWIGVRNGTQVSGSIENVAGQVHICVLICGDATFNGQGEFTGSVNASQASGSIAGTVTFVSSPVPQIPVNESMPMSGSWSAAFATPVAEFQPGFTTLLSTFAVCILLISIHRRVARQR
jgi:hypothetical protein